MTLPPNSKSRVEERTRELMSAEEALRQSQKMEAVGQLTGGLAHDFNNLLTGISGSLQLMQTRLSQGRVDELDRYITAAEGAARRAASLTHRLLAFSRRQTLDPKPININRLISDLEELIRRTVGPSIQVEVVGAAGLWTAFVDPNQLENALLNLASTRATRCRTAAASLSRPPTNGSTSAPRASASCRRANISRFA